jgi:hypothetical protein
MYGGVGKKPGKHREPPTIIVWVDERLYMIIAEILRAKWSGVDAGV